MSGWRGGCTGGGPYLCDTCCWLNFKSLALTPAPVHNTTTPHHTCSYYSPADNNNNNGVTSEACYWLIKVPFLCDMKVMSNSWLMRPFFASVRNDCLHSPSAQQLSGLLPEIKWLLWCEDSGGPQPLFMLQLSCIVFFSPFNEISMVMKLKKDVYQVEVANFLEIMNIRMKVKLAQLRPAPVWRVSWAVQWWVRGVLCCLFISLVLQLWHRCTSIYT